MKKNYEIHKQSEAQRNVARHFSNFDLNKETAEINLKINKERRRKNNNYVFKSRIKHLAIILKKAPFIFRFIILILKKENLWFSNREISH